MGDVPGGRAALLPPTALGSRLRARGHDGAPDGQFRLPDRRPRHGRGARGRSCVRRRGPARHPRRRRHAPDRSPWHALPSRPPRRARWRGWSLEGISTLLEHVQVPVHVQQDELPWVERTTGVGADDLVGHSSGDVVRVGEVDIELIHTPGHTPGQPVLPGRRQARGRRHTLPRRLRPHRLPRARTHSPCTSPSTPDWPASPTRPSCSRVTCTPLTPRRAWVRPGGGTTSSGRALHRSGWPCSAGDAPGRRWRPTVPRSSSAPRWPAGAPSRPCAPKASRARSRWWAPSGTCPTTALRCPNRCWPEPGRPRRRCWRTAGVPASCWCTRSSVGRPSDSTSKGGRSSSTTARSCRRTPSSSPPVRRRGRLPGTESLGPADGLFTLRTIDDSLALRAAVTAVPQARVVVIGAGFIGAEVASTCAALGLPGHRARGARNPVASCARSRARPPLRVALRRTRRGPEDGACR